MNSRPTGVIVTGILLIAVQLCPVSVVQSADGTKEDGAVLIYLPREVTSKDECLLLGQVGLIRGSEAVVSKISQIPIGRFSVPGQELVIDRQMVLSRLACSTVPSVKVTLLGAEKVKVKQQQQVIKGSELVDRASAFLKANPPAASIYHLEPLAVPQDFAVPGESKTIELRPRSGQTSTGNCAKVQIAILQEGKQIGLREVTFRLKYSCRKAVAIADIPAGAVINSENVKIENAVSNQPQSTDWKSPFGLVAKRHLPAGTIISSSAAGPAARPLVVKRNQSVIIRIERPGLIVTAVGRTLEEGRAGEHIKVRNADSQRIILARINEDGTVEPVL